MKMSTIIRLDRTAIQKVLECMGDEQKIELQRAVAKELIKKSINLEIDKKILDPIINDYKYYVQRVAEEKIFHEVQLGYRSKNLKLSEELLDVVEKAISKSIKEKIEEIIIKIIEEKTTEIDDYIVEQIERRLDYRIMKDTTYLISSSMNKLMKKFLKLIDEEIKQNVTLEG